MFCDCHNTEVCLTEEEIKNVQGIQGSRGIQGSIGIRGLSGLLDYCYAFSTIPPQNLMKNSPIN